VKLLGTGTEVVFWIEFALNHVKQESKASSHTQCINNSKRKEKILSYIIIMQMIKRFI
jgi:hypothetical protein